MHYQYDNILYTSRLVNIGTFNCPVDSPNFTNTGPIGGYLIAFPRCAVKIRHTDSTKTIVADPNIVTIYNRGQEYERFALSDYGDHCDWLTVCPEIVCEALNVIGVAEENSERLFNISHGISPPKAYSLFHKLVINLAEPDRLKNSMAIEEIALEIFHAAISNAYQSHGKHVYQKRLVTTYKHEKLVQRAQEIMATRYNDPLSLDELSRETNSSPYHLSRVFHRIAGMTIHQYLTQLRLRNSLQPLIHTKTDLSTLGLNLGFSDHSHFSRYFRETFGLTPSDYRKAPLIHPDEQDLHSFGCHPLIS